MPANTPKGYPYPLGTDRLMDGDDAIHALATAIDTNLGAAAAGIASLPAPSGAGVATSLAVTFPAGRFTAPPIVVSNGIGGGTALGPCTNAGATASGVTLYSQRVSGSMAPISVGWYAVQLP